MAICSLPHIKIPLLSSNLPQISRQFPSSLHNNQLPSSRLSSSSSSSSCYKPLASYRFPPGRRSIEEEDDDEDDFVESSGSKFTEAVALFNSRDYHGCHDYLEDIWNDSEDPIRSLVHGILQCAVGFHHLFNQNHKGAMMEMGEGLCKLRKMNFDSGPFHQFERDMTAVLDFIYQTQLEFAACNDDMCVSMDQSETSYRLLGGYGAGQHLYWLEMDGSASLYIVFSPDRSIAGDHQPRIVGLYKFFAARLRSLNNRLENSRSKNVCLIFRSVVNEPVSSILFGNEPSTSKGLLSSVRLVNNPNTKWRNNQGGTSYGGLFKDVFLL